MGPWRSTSEDRSWGRETSAQTRQALENIKALVEAAGGTLMDVTQLTVYITDLANSAGMNEVYRTYFPVDPPARATVRVDLGNPDFLIEIQGTAVIGRPAGPPETPLPHGRPFPWGSALHGPRRHIRCGRAPSDRLLDGFAQGPEAVLDRLPRDGERRTDLDRGTAKAYRRKEEEALLEGLRYPDSPLAGNAQYWIGEANYVYRDYEAALVEFRKVISAYPNSGKIPDAMLNIGFIHDEQGNTEKARATLSQVKTRYPDSSAARLADERLTKLKQ